MLGNMAVNGAVLVDGVVGTDARAGLAQAGESHVSGWQAGIVDQHYVHRHALRARPMIRRGQFDHGRNSSRSLGFGTATMRRFFRERFCRGDLVIQGAKAVGGD